MLPKKSGPVLVHGDLTASNVVMRLSPGPSSAASPTQSCGEVSRWLEEHGLREHCATFEREGVSELNLLHWLQEADLKEMRLPIGARARFRRAVNTLPANPANSASTANSANSASTAASSAPSRGWQAAGIVDFGDARFGDALLELVSVHVSVFQCRPSLLKEFLREYRQARCGAWAKEANWHKRAMQLVLLHPSRNCLAYLFECVPEARSAQSWDEVARMVFSDAH